MPEEISTASLAVQTTRCPMAESVRDSARREASLDQLQRVAHIRRKKDVEWRPIADLREQIAGRAGNQFQDDLRMRFVEGPVEFFKARRPDRTPLRSESSRARHRLSANCRHRQQNDQNDAPCRARYIWRYVTQARTLERAAQFSRSLSEDLQLILSAGARIERNLDTNKMGRLDANRERRTPQVANNLSSEVLIS